MLVSATADREVVQRLTSRYGDLQIESVAYTHSLKELTLLVNTQQAITKDNVTIRIDGVLYIRIVDPFKASYGVDRPLYAVMQLAQTSMRSELGKMTLDNTFNERDSLNDKIVQVRGSLCALPRLQPTSMQCATPCCDRTLVC